MAPTQTAPTPLPVRQKPQRPQLDLVPFPQKDPNAVIGRLERERTVLEDRLNDAGQIIDAQARYIAELELYAGLREPGGAPSTPEPAPEPA